MRSSAAHLGPYPLTGLVMHLSRDMSWTSEEKRAQLLQRSTLQCHYAGPEPFLADD